LNTILSEYIDDIGVVTEILLPVYRTAEAYRSPLLNLPIWPPARRGQESKKRAIFSARWNQPELSIYGDGLNSSIVVVNSLSLAKSYLCVEINHCLIVVSDELLLNTEILVQVFSGGSIMMSQTYAVDKVDLCLVPDCFFCSEFYSHFDCFSPAYKGLLVMAWIFIVALLVASPFITYFLVMFIYRRVYQTRFDSATVMMLILFLPLVAAQSSCVGTLVTVSDLTTCTLLDSGLLTCEADIVLSGTVRFAGDKICVGLKSDKDVALGYISVEFLSQETLLPLSLAYYTSNWEPVSNANKYCRYILGTGDNDHCGANDCSSAHGTDPSLGGAITGSSLAYPGRSVCVDSCGCAGCGCFSCDSACLYGRWSIKPVPSIWEVHIIERVGEIKTYGRICYKSVADETETCSDVYLSGMFSLFGFDFDFTNNQLTRTESFYGKNLVSGLNNGETISYLDFVSKTNVPENNQICYIPLKYTSEQVSVSSATDL